jgi:hypothetical protein
MKNLKSFLLIFFFPLFGFAQSLNGVYTGVLSNDSTTIRKDQSFEMALTEYNGKVYGYAYSTFIINDTLYYIVKRVKGKVEGDICEVEDDEVITHNFPQKPEKKVFVTYTLKRNASDSVWRLDGNWKTNLVKKRYYSISGKVETKEEKDLSKSKLYEHLGDLDLQKTLSFNKPKEKAPEKKPVNANEDKNAIAKNTVKKEDKKDTQNTDSKPVDKKPDASIAKIETKLPDNKTASVNKQPDQTVIAVTNANGVDKKTESIIAKTETKLADNKPVSEPINNQPSQTEKKVIAVTNTNAVDKKPDASVAKTETKLADNKPVSVLINNPPNQNEKKNDVVNNANPVDKKPETSVIKPETKLPDNKPVIIASNNQPNQNEKKNVAATNTNPVEKKSETNIVKTENKLPDSKIISVPVNNQPGQTEKKSVAAVNTNAVDKKPDVSIVKVENQTEKKDVIAKDNKSDNEFEFQELKRNRKLKPAASLVDGRVSVPSETIYFKSDIL